MFALGVIGIFFVLWLVRFLWLRRRLFILSFKVPGPTNYPIIGMAHLLLGTTDEMFKTVLKIVADFPGLSKCWFGSELFYMVSKPEFFEKLLTHPGAVGKSFLYRPVREIMGPDEIFLADSVKWKIARKLLAPSFNQKSLNRFVSCFQEQSEILVESIEKNSKIGEIVDLEISVTNYIADVVAETLFDCEINAQERKLPIGELIDKFFEIVILEGTRPWFHIDAIFKRTNLYKEKNKVMEKINAITTEIFDLNKNVINLKNQQKNEKNTKLKSLIEILFTRKSKDPKFTDENIKHEITTFLVAAVDTTTISICFIVLLLGMHPEIQAKIRSEVTEITEEREDKTMKTEDMPLLKYTERVIKESLRLFPPAPFIVRKIESDVKLDESITLPQGANVLLDFFSVHRDAKYWKNPLKFDPDRFSTDATHPYAWNAFAGGLRNCIGYRYAMMMMKVMTAAIVKNFDISTDYTSVAEVALKLDVLIKPQNGHKIYMRPRK